MTTKVEFCTVAVPSVGVTRVLPAGQRGSPVEKGLQKMSTSAGRAEMCTSCMEGKGYFRIIPRCACRLGRTLGLLGSQTVSRERAWKDYTSPGKVSSDTPISSSSSSSVLPPSSPWDTLDSMSGTSCSACR